VFGATDELDHGGRRAARALADRRRLLGTPGEVYCGPAPAARQTAEALGHPAMVEPALADCAYGSWAGRPLAEVAAARPEAVHRWLTDPDAAPHGGESVTALLGRVAGWLDGHRDADARILAVVPAAVVRAALVHVLRTPPVVFWQVDVAPLSVTWLRFRREAWSLHLMAPE
jgi:broad specificity phosphatase PhoE